MVAVLTAHSGLRPEAKRYIMAGRGVVVDVGGRGDFSALQDACDYWAGRGTGGRIFLREGVHSPCVVSQDDVSIIGSGHAAIIDGAAAAHAVKVTGDRVLVADLQAKTTASGGTAFSPIRAEGAAYCTYRNLYISGSDSIGVNLISSSSNSAVLGCRLDPIDEEGLTLSSPYCRAEGNLVGNTGSVGIHVTATGDGAVITGNVVGITANDGIMIEAGGDNCLVVGNKIDQWTNEAIDDNSGTSTVASNETTV